MCIEQHHRSGTALGNGCTTPTTQHVELKGAKKKWHEIKEEKNCPIYEAMSSAVESEVVQGSILPQIHSHQDEEAALAGGQKEEEEEREGSTICRFSGLEACSPAVAAGRLRLCVQEGEGQRDQRLNFTIMLCYTRPCHVTCGPQCIRGCGLMV